ncbi:MogA/MoaB family molybdenum cofactor biosynthesis protein [bacterium]|nr:MogA/MoaB family molybdenum cofactor biosynthesis protein [bacterium]
MRYAVLTISDKGSIGEREDTSGPALREIMNASGWTCAYHGIIPDDISRIESELRRLADNEDVGLILTTGGTGLAPRDVTPEATMAVADREAPGFAEAMRMTTFAKVPAAILSRGVSAVRGRTLIVNLPGSKKGATECLEVIETVLPHAVRHLRGETDRHDNAPACVDK